MGKAGLLGSQAGLTGLLGNYGSNEGRGIESPLSSEPTFSWPSRAVRHLGHQLLHHPGSWIHRAENSNALTCADMESSSADLQSEIIFEPSSSRSCSPTEPSSDGISGKLNRQDSKICGVCGDKALGNNFNAITCESCKAFFRRNALKTKEFVCPFNDNCKVDAVTRRFCQKCRLKKCFDIGMKKEWIMTDEEKKMKKIKIQQNRMKRQSSDSPACDTPVTKAACMVGPKVTQIDQVSIPQDSPPDPTVPHKILKQAMMPHGDEESQFKDAYPPLSGLPSLEAPNCESDGSNDQGEVSRMGWAAKFGGTSPSKLETPLLTSLIRPGLAESPPDPDFVESQSGDDNQGISVLAVGIDEVDHHHHSNISQAFENVAPSNLVRLDEALREEIQTTPSDSSEIGEHENYFNSLPLPLNTMDSIVSVAIKAEFSSYGALNCRGINSSQSRLLNKAEQNKLDELLLASQALNAPIDAEGLVKVSDQSLINVINLTDIAIRRLIKMSKKISAFKNMCQEDQIALLKGGCTEMMILRSVVSYDPDRDSWKIPHSKLGYNINLGVLKEARGNLYEEHQRFLKSFKTEWRSDENIMMLLCSITLFTPERPNVIHKDVVKLEQDSYYYLLKRYLESILDGCEARSSYLRLIKIIAELRILNSNHLKVFLALNPREVGPLLIEIFDLK